MKICELARDEGAAICGATNRGGLPRAEVPTVALHGSQFTVAAGTCEVRMCLRMMGQGCGPNRRRGPETDRRAADASAFGADVPQR